jgi:hypothetical protein
MASRLLESRIFRLCEDSLNVHGLYCILASCYIRLTLNICSFVHQCNTFTSYILLIADIAPASGEYTITTEDGHVRPKHVDD